MVKIVFFATPKIALKSFKALVKSGKYEVLALVTQPPRAANRGKKVIDSDIKKLALENNIKIFEPERISKDPEAICALKCMEPDFFVTFAFGQILSQEVLDIPKHGTINLHASLLPKYRGADPIRCCLLNGDCKSGITTMLTVLELDAGDICLCDEIELSENINSIELGEVISERSPVLIQETIDKLLSKELTPKEQEHSEATFTKKITKADKEIDWTQDGRKIHNKIRALVGNYTTQSTFRGKIIKFIKSAHVQNLQNIQNSQDAQAGEVLNVSKAGVLVKCTNDAILLQEVKPEGKGTMSAYSWSLGSGIKAGDKFEYQRN